MLARLSAFVIWALVAGSVVFWVLRMGVGAPSAPAHAVTVADGGVVRGDLTRLFGAAPPPPPPDSVAQPVEPALASRFRLVGVVAPKVAGRPEGLALIAVDGQPPKAYRVGAVIDGQRVLQGVHARGAMIGPRAGVPEVTLELPALPPPATGSLPPPGTAAAPGMPIPAGGGVPGYAPPPAGGVSTYIPPPMPGQPMIQDGQDGVVDPGDAGAGPVNQQN